jgi:hypothetical protein
VTIPTEKVENDALMAGTVAADALRGVEVAAVVLIGLLVCPTLAILAVVVVVPLLGALDVSSRRELRNALPETSVQALAGFV